MERAIFKAKTLDDNTWVYGYFVKYPDSSCVIFSKEKYESYSVKEETLCRCLNETDKNGDFIYINDMVNDFCGGVYELDKEHSDYDEKMAFPPMKCVGDNTRIGIVVEEDGTTRIRTKEIKYSYNISNGAKLCDMEIVGNIFD